MKREQYRRQKVTGEIARILTGRNSYVAEVLVKNEGRAKPALPENIEVESYEADVVRCPHVLAVGDDYGDNPCTFRCQLPKDHPGPHVESSVIYTRVQYAVSWVVLDLENEANMKEEGEVVT